MEFKTIQSSKTLDIIMYFVENKRVSRNKFLHLEHLQMLRGGKYNTSFTEKTASGNFKHVASL